MTSAGFGGRLLKHLAAASRLLYPREIRSVGRDAFVEVALHRLSRELTRHRPPAAVLAAAQVLVADAFASVPAAWKSVLLGEGPSRGAGHLFSRLRGHFNGFGHEVRFTLRNAARHPGSTLLLVGTLGVGIGTSTAAFDALDRTVLNPLPYEQDGALVLLVMQDPTFEGFYGVRLEQVQAWRERTRTISRIEIFRRTSATRQRPEGADVLEGISVSGGLPGMLGLAPVAGRMFVPADAEASAPATVMLTEQFWRREYGADPSVIGRPITIGTTPTEVIGIWPDDARLDFHGPPDVIRVMPAGREYRGGAWVQVLARIAPGRTRQEVEAELATLVVPDTNDPREMRPLTVRAADLLLGGPFVAGIWMVFAGALLLLGGALANAAHLLLERAVARQHDFAVRLALGASRLRLARLFVTEALFYGGAALALGALVTVGLERAITLYEPRLFGDVAGAGLAGRAFRFAAAAAAVAVAVCVLAPLLRAGRRQLVTDINCGQGRTSRQRSPLVQTLVGMQAAFAVLLVSGAALIGHSLLRLLAVDPGMAVHQLAEVSVALPAARYPTPEARLAYAQRVEEALRALPSVTGVVTSGMPILNTSITSNVPRLEGEPEAGDGETLTATNSVPPQYFEVTGMRMLAGRAFTADEPRAVVVSERFARKRQGSVLGRRLYMPPRPEPYEIVGVVKDAALMGLDEEDATRAAIYYLDPPNRGESSLRFIIRTTGDPQQVIAGARARLAEIDPMIPLRAAQTGLDVIGRQTAQHRLVAFLLGGLAVVGFLLAMSGVYGAVALSVVRRTREVGVRMALGASAGRLVRQFVREGLVPVLLGCAAGVLITLVAAPRADPLLFQTDPHHPIGLFGLTIVLAVGAIAAALPARRISRIDPASTLRD